MINRQDCYNALFKLKNAGVNIDEQLSIMTKETGVPRGVIEFLRNNSPQFQFYRYLQKYQKALAESILDYSKLDYESKIVAASSFITRVYLSVKYKNLDASLTDDLDIEGVSDALHDAILTKDTGKLDIVMEKHTNSLGFFYLNKRSDSDDSKDDR